MNCAEFREELFCGASLQVRLSRRLHGWSCAACRQHAAEASQIGQALRTLPRHPAPEGLRERLIRTGIEEAGASRRRRFAWSQVLVAVATVLILSAILYPVVNLVRQKAASEGENPASAVTCLSNLRQLGTGLAIYARDYDDRLPDVREWQPALLPYLGVSTDSSLFWCPEDTDPTHWPSYAMLPSLSRADLNSIEDWGKRAVLYDAEADGSFARRHTARNGIRGGNAAYADGHAGFSRDAPLGVPETSVPR